MERFRIKCVSDGIKVSGGMPADIISDLKAYLEKTDNKSFDQMKMRAYTEKGKIVIDSVTGIKYPEFDEFVACLKNSRFGNMFIF